MNDKDKELIKSIVKECEYGFISYSNLHNNNDTGLDLIKESLERTLKYAWHDLRKNPDDLPEDRITVLIRVDVKLGCSIFHNVVDIGIYIPNNHVWVLERLHNLPRGLTVIAWKEIEPIEEAEE